MNRCQELDGCYQAFCVTLHLGHSSNHALQSAAARFLRLFLRQVHHQCLEAATTPACTAGWVAYADPVHEGLRALIQSFDAAAAGCASLRLLGCLLRAGRATTCAAGVAALQQALADPWLLAAAPPAAAHGALPRLGEGEAAEAKGPHPSRSPPAADPACLTAAQQAAAVAELVRWMRACMETEGRRRRTTLGEHISAARRGAGSSSGGAAAGAAVAWLMTPAGRRAGLRSLLRQRDRGGLVATYLAAVSHCITRVVVDSLRELAPGGSWATEEGGGQGEGKACAAALTAIGPAWTPAETAAAPSRLLRQALQQARCAGAGAQAAHALPLPLPPTAAGPAHAAPSPLAGASSAIAPSAGEESADCALTATRETALLPVVPAGAAPDAGACVGSKRKLNPGHMQQGGAGHAAPREGGAPGPRASGAAGSSGPAAHAATGPAPAAPSSLAADAAPIRPPPPKRSRREDAGAAHGGTGLLRAMDLEPRAVTGTSAELLDGRASASSRGLDAYCTHLKSSAAPLLPLRVFLARRAAGADPDSSPDAAAARDLCGASVSDGTRRWLLHALQRRSDRAQVLQAWLEAPVASACPPGLKSRLPELAVEAGAPFTPQESVTAASRGQLALLQALHRTGEPLPAALVAFTQSGAAPGEVHAWVLRRQHPDSKQLTSRLLAGESVQLPLRGVGHGPSAAAAGRAAGVAPMGSTLQATVASSPPLARRTSLPVVGQSAPLLDSIARTHGGKASVERAPAAAARGTTQRTIVGTAVPDLQPMHGSRPHSAASLARMVSDSLIQLLQADTEALLRSPQTCRQGRAAGHSAGASAVDGAAAVCLLPSSMGAGAHLLPTSRCAAGGSSCPAGTAHLSPYSSQPPSLKISVPKAAMDSASPPLAPIRCLPPFRGSSAPGGVSASASRKPHQRVRFSEEIRVLGEGAPVPPPLPLPATVIAASSAAALADDALAATAAAVGEFAFGNLRAWSATLSDLTAPDRSSNVIGDSWAAMQAGTTINPAADRASSQSRPSPAS
jgi:hypothetical protein